MLCLRQFLRASSKKDWSKLFVKKQIIALIESVLFSAPLWQNWTRNLRRRAEGLSKIMDSPKTRLDRSESKT